mgnify:CR=1 FL=1
MALTLYTEDQIFSITIGYFAALFPQAYAHITTGKSVQWLPRLRPWLLAMGGVAVGYLLISHVVWQTQSSKVAGAVERIQELRLERATREAKNRAKNPATPGAATPGSSNAGSAPSPTGGPAK